MIEAAGGVVWRTSARGSVKVLVIHRPRYDDWSLPKGKLERGERARDAALREVLEETGLSCTLGPELHTARYRDRHRRAKRVRYWAMRATAGAFRANDEVDEVRWVRIDEAHAVLTYARDVAVLESLEQHLAPVR